MSSATIDQAIVARWKEQNCDILFTGYWEDSADQRHHPFNGAEARAGTPMPYCCYEKGTPIFKGRSTGASCESDLEVEYWVCPIQFRLHGKTPIRGQKSFGRTGKDILAQIIGRSEPDGYGLLKAFDDATGPLALGGNDRFMCIEAGPDFDTREDDDVWAWVLQFTVQFERRRKLRGVPAS